MTLMQNATRFSVLLIQEVVGHQLYRFAFCDHFFCTAIFILCVASCPQNTQILLGTGFFFSLLRFHMSSCFFSSISELPVTKRLCMAS